MKTSRKNANFSTFGTLRLGTDLAGHSVLVRRYIAPIEPPGITSWAIA